MIIELLGLAGAGKSSLGSQLCKKPDVIFINRIPYYRHIKEIPFFIKNTSLLLPTLLTELAHSQTPREQKFIWMAALNGWHQRLARLNKPNRLIVIDEGPIYYLTYFYVHQLIDDMIKANNLHIRDTTSILSLAYENSFGAQTKVCENVCRWLNSMYAAYANTLDTLIWLDADNQVLIDRVHNRNMPHGINLRSNQEANQFLDNFRSIYQIVIGNLMRENPHISLIKIRTEDKRTSEISELIFQHLGVRDS